MSYKRLKKEIEQILINDSPEKFYSTLENYNPHMLVNPLMGLLYDPRELIKFRSVEAIGFIMEKEAHKNIETVKNIMRRFMWNLNEESGGIGWGSPEAMAEIAARSQNIFSSFAKIIISYIDPESTSYLDHKELHPGIIWGIGRLGKANPDTGSLSEYIFNDILDDPDPRIKGLGVWACGICKIGSLKLKLKNLLNDNSEFTLYEDHILFQTSVSSAAKKALSLIN